MSGSKRSARRNAGYFGIAVYQPKTQANVGTLWRSAFLYNAAFVATIGRRYSYQSSDTPSTTNHVPLMHYRDLDDLVEHLPYSCPLVGVELTTNAVSLRSFNHPRRALYMLGSEDHGLPAAVQMRCHSMVQIPTARDWSMNVAVAGSILMYDRYDRTEPALQPERNPRYA